MPSAEIHIDGGSRGNPGPAAFAYVIRPADGPVVELGQTMVRSTNNVAEYTALVEALSRAATLGLTELHIRSDSELLVKQMNGEYRVKNEDLKPLYEAASDLRSKFAKVTIEHIRRESNKRADELCNIAMDGGKVKPKVSSHSPAPAVRADDAIVREEAIVCIQAALDAARRGDAIQGDAVWEQLWFILTESGVLKKPSRSK